MAGVSRLVENCGIHTQHRHPASSRSHHRLATFTHHPPAPAAPGSVMRWSTSVGHAADEQIVERAVPV